MGARILIVEDNRTNLDLMLYLLRAFGHDAEGETDAVAGLEAARSGGFDVVLSDILMPGIDGYELARRFRSDPGTASAKLVAVTALAMVGDKERVLQSGFDGYIAKPIDPATFVAQVDAFVPPDRRSDRKTGATQSTREEIARERPQGPIVLAVDDVQVNLDVIAGALRPFGFRVIEARGGDEAYEKARANRPALILCDVHMPHGDGFAFIERVKADPDLQSVPFMFVSSTAWRSHDKMRGLDLGASKFLTRPIDPALLLEEVQQALQDDDRGEDSHR